MRRWIALVTVVLALTATDRPVAGQGVLTPGARPGGGPPVPEPRSLVGVVQSVHGTSVILATPDGRSFTVDVAQVPETTRAELREGLTVRVTGLVTGSRMTATSLEIAEPEPGPPGDGEPVRITGTVTSLEWPTVVLSTPDGRSVSIDVGELPAPARSTLVAGQSVTIVGELAGDRVVARAVEPVTPEGATPADGVRGR